MITRVKWKNHNILGNLELDFTKDGKSYNTVVIAGENGTGKTTILETLYNFLYRNQMLYFNSLIEYIEYEIGSDRFRIYINKSSMPSFECKDLNTKEVFYPDDIDKRNIRSYGLIYSKAKLGLNADPVQSITSRRLDDFQGTIVDDRSDDPTTMKQLLVDIASQDSFEYSKLSRTGVIDYESFEKNSRIYRFKNAFNEFFKNIIQFDRVDLQNIGEKSIIFKKYGNEIPIDSLSTGEKQIVFRGSYLLQDQKQMDGGIILIDEPELSMHPLWQEKILDYYRDLFKTDNKQNVQMIFATHSEYVIKSALEDRENVLVIALKNDNGKIESQRVITPTVLSSITLAETNYNTFNITSIDYHIQLYGYLQDLIGEDTITKCDKYIENYINSHHNIDKAIHFKQSSYTDKKGNVINYNTLSTYIRNAIDHPNNGNKYTDQELKASIELLIEIIKNQNNTKI